MSVGSGDERSQAARRLSVAMNVMLSDVDKDMLVAIAARRRVSQGQVVRDLITYGYMMLCEGTPTCASGAGCFVSHLHHRQGQEPHMSNAPSGAVPGRLPGVKEVG